MFDRIKFTFRKWKKMRQLDNEVFRLGAILSMSGKLSREDQRLLDKNNEEWFRVATEQYDKNLNKQK